MAIADVVGDQAYIMLLEPFRHERLFDRGEEFKKPTVFSLLGDEKASERADFYSVVYEFSAPYLTSPSQVVSNLLSADQILTNIKIHIDLLAQKKAQQIQGFIDMGIKMLPIVGTVDEFVKGNYMEGAISLVGDLTWVTGYGAALKARNCLVVGRKMLKFASATTLVLEGGVVATRLGQGFHALGGGRTADALGYFGDATLRLFGMAAQGVQFLRKPKCFVAGTPVHAEQGVQPIEQIAPGQRVWAFDRQQGDWRLCRVRQTFQRTSDVLTTVRFSDDEELTGTDGHPFWVIEGEELASRPAGDHGAGEPPSTTPGRWVNMASLRAGDEVLTRQGRVRRVISVATRAEAAPVYNFEVEGLHSYAVGAAGVLVHNTLNCGGAAQAKVASEFAEAAKKPAVQVDKTATPQKGTKPAVPKDTATVAEAPPAGKSKPVSEGADRSKKSRNRPRVTQMTHRMTIRRQAQESLTTADEAILNPLLKKHDDALNIGNHAATTAAGEELGKAGVQQYMKTRPQYSKAELVHTGRKGKDDLDFVFFDEAAKTFYVSEAKGLKGARRSRNLAPVGAAAEHAQQGSEKYLDGTLKVMRDSGDPVRRDIATKLIKAREGMDGFKVVYMEVATRKRAGGNLGFTISHFIE